jgi:hypothetical protein
MLSVLMPCLFGGMERERAIFRDAGLDSIEAAHVGGWIGNSIVKVAP